MALQLSLTYLQQNSCSEMVLTDNTGAYNASSNPTGWGTPNLEINDGSVTVAEIIVERYTDSTTLETVETLDVIGLWESLTGLTSDPFDTGTTVSNVIYTITSDMVNFSDGCYRITYRVGDGSTYDGSTNKSSVTYNIATYCNIECCIEQRLADTPNKYECITCSNSHLDTTSILWTLLQALKLAACLASIDSYLTILSTIQAACEQAGCECSS